MNVVSQFNPNFETGISRQTYYILQYLEKIGQSVSLFTWEPEFRKPFYWHRWVVYPVMYLPLRAEAAPVFYYGEYWSMPVSEFDAVNLPVFWYAPLDSDRLPEDWWQSAAIPDVIVPFTEFAHDLLIGEVSKRFENNGPVVWNVIPHTVAVFDSDEREDWSNEQIHVGIVFRPQMRKNPCGLLAALRELRLPNLKIHIVSEDQFGEVNLPSLCATFGLDCDIRQGLSPLEMRKFYNSIDIYVSFSMGEGFDLGLAEALKCRKCVLVPDLFTAREFGVPEEHRVKCREFKLPTKSRWWVAEIDDFVEKFKSLMERDFPIVDADMSRYEPNAVGPLWQDFFENAEEVARCV